MAEIPAGSKFIMIDPSVPTKELKSARSNGKTEVYTIEDIKETIGGGSEYAETIVNISSAQILTMGTSPIELLPAAGIGKYYDIDKIIIEFSKGSIPYVFENLDSLRFLGYGVFDADILTSSPFDFSFNPNGKGISPNNIAIGQVMLVNFPITLSVVSGMNPTDGNGTLRVKIYHKTITFGA
jgi:hypothetical protein